MSLSDFHAGTTKKFEVAITYNNEIPDITNDTVIFYLKDNKTDTSYILTASADVTSSAGIAKFNLSAEQTDINPEIYFYEILWTLANGEKQVLPLNDPCVRIIERI